MRQSALLRRIVGTILAAVFVVVVCIPLAIRAAQTGVHYLPYGEVRDLIRIMTNAGAPDMPSSDIKDAASWNSWIQARDREIRGRIDRGIEDSISNLILFGTSYTSLPPIPNANDSADSNGRLTTASRDRIRALEKAINEPGGNERVRFSRKFLWQHKVGSGDADSYLTANLERLILEEREFERKQRAAQQSGDPDDVFMTRATIYKDRGLSFDTSLEPDYAFETMLAQLKQKGELPGGGIKRIAVMGPGLDFADKRIGLDFYPIQTIQPFAIMESVLRLGSGTPENIRVVAFDLNPAVLAHIERVAEQGRLNHPYVVQLPNDSRNQWTPELNAYWRHFGEILGAPTQAIGPPAQLEGVEVRAVTIRPGFAQRLSGQDLNMVAQRLDLSAGEKFDLVIASNVFVYYNFFEQALAMQNISHMMSPGGIFLVNQVLSNQHPDSLKMIDQCSVNFNAKGAFGDIVVAYQQQ